MCGVVGAFGKKVDPLWVTAESIQMTYRGPDAQITKSITPWLTMGVSRLAMTDPHPRSNQPMTDENTGNVISFNGEIYNYQQLRRELWDQGITFSTESDTEVLLKFVGLYGIERLNEVNGMFAFAFYLRSQDILILARDRLGKKPLYYSISDGLLRWSSSLKSLKSSETKKQLSNEGLVQYLSLGYLIDPVTTNTEIHSVVPGSTLSFKRANLSNGFSMNFFISASNQPDNDDQSDLRDLIAQSVRDRISGHDNVALSLSGGVDSSIVAYEVSHQRESACAFTAVWSDSDKTRYNTDSDVAEKISNKLGLKIQKVEMLHSKNLTSELEKYLAYMEEPNNNPTGVSMLNLYKRIAESGYRLVLTGDGADEIFGGYERHLKASKHKNFLNLRNSRLISHFYANVQSSNSQVGKLLVTQFSPKSPLSWLHWHWIFTPAELINVTRINQTRKKISDVMSRYILDIESESITQNPLSIMKRDHEIWLAMESNRKLDRISMRNSIEARSPFQDDRIVGWASNQMKINSIKNLSKVALWKSYPELLELGVRRDKAGFTSPVGHWLRSNPKLVESSLYFLSRDSRFNLAGLNFYKDAPQRGRYRELMQLWTLVVLATWLQIEA